MEIRHHQFERITMDPEKCFGKPCVRGLRMPVASILAYLSGGMSIDKILKEWPLLEREDIYQALGFAAALMEEQIIPIEQR
jgi:uncharacterized protein (DUF433 family)